MSKQCGLLDTKSNLEDLVSSPDKFSTLLNVNWKIIFVSLLCFSHVKNYISAMEKSLLYSIKLLPVEINQDYVNHHLFCFVEMRRQAEEKVWRAKGRLQLRLSGKVLAWRSCSGDVLEVGTFYVISLGCIFGFFWLILSWKWGQQLGSYQLLIKSWPFGAHFYRGYCLASSIVN